MLRSRITPCLLIRNKGLVKPVNFKSEKYEVFTHNARNNTGKCPTELARKMEQCGVGELVINSIDNDGVMKGYDLELLEGVRSSVTVPLTALGGAGSIKDIAQLISR